MGQDAAEEITALLWAWNGGDEQALEKLTPLVYAELYRSARRCLAGRRRGASVQATALINELYLRVLGMNRIGWQSRAHFFAICARQMRWILTDLYRAGRFQKRGAGAAPVSLDQAAVLTPAASPDLLAIDEALSRLAELDARKGQVVELRFFGGLSVRETAQALGVSPETVLREWKLAKSWLLTKLDGRQSHAGGTLEAD